MDALLRADWIRIRRRWDVWVVTVGVPVLALLMYWNGARSVSGMWSDASGNVAYCSNADSYVFPTSIVTAATAGAPWHAIGFAFLAATLLGSEFDWGTIRNVALFRPDRRRYMLSRLVWVVALAAGSLAAVTAIGFIAPSFIGPQYPSCGSPARPIALGAAVGLACSWLILTLAAVALAGAMALVFRSASTGVLAAAIAAFADMFVANFVISNMHGPILYLPQLSFTTRLGAFMSDVYKVTLGSGNPGNPTNQPGWIELPPFVGAAILAAWLVGLFGVWFWRIRTVDVHE